MRELGRGEGGNTDDGGRRDLRGHRDEPGAVHNQGSSSVLIPTLMTTERPYSGIHCAPTTTSEARKGSGSKLACAANAPCPPAYTAGWHRLAQRVQKPTISMSKQPCTPSVPRRRPQS